MDWGKLFETLQTQGLKFISGLVVLAVGLFLVHWLQRLAAVHLKKVRLEPTVQTFLVNVIRIVLYIIVILTAANVMGIPLTSIVTLVASAGVAVSLALQGALSNLVGGVMLLILKPIRVGEYVKISDANGSIEGTVKTLGAFYTELTMPDLRRISIPNSSLTNTPIINYSREGTRRLDVIFPVSYHADMQQVFAVLKALIAANPDVLRDPEPVVHVSAYAESRIDYVVRVWCKTENYWPINYYMLEEGRRVLDEAGIGIPYPQMIVRMKEESGISYSSGNGDGAAG